MEAWGKNLILVAWQCFGFAIGFLSDGLTAGLLTMTAVAIVAYLSALADDRDYAQNMCAAEVYASVWTVLINADKLTGLSFLLKAILALIFSIALAIALGYYAEKAADSYEETMPTSLSFTELIWLMLPFGIGVAAGAILGIVYQLRKRDRDATS